MNKVLDHYLEKIDQYLRPMPASERVDIVKEIKSSILDLKDKEGLTDQQIIQRLGNSKQLAKAYLGESISKNSAFSLRRLGAVLAFYSLAGLGGMFLLPIVSVLSVGLMICGAVSPLAGIIKFVGYLLGYEVPFVVVQLGFYTPGPLLSLPLSIVMGLLLFLGGWGLWKLTIRCIRMFSRKKRKLNQM